jgi:hypothetical protein
MTDDGCLRWPARPGYMNRVGSVAEAQSADSASDKKQIRKMQKMIKALQAANDAPTEGFSCVHAMLHAMLHWTFPCHCRRTDGSCGCWRRWLARDISAEVAMGKRVRRSGGCRRRTGS